MTDQIQTQLEQKALDMFDALQNGVVTLAGKAMHYSPDIEQAVYGVLKFDGISKLFAYGFWMLLVLVLIGLMIWGCHQTLKENKNSEISPGIFIVMCLVVVFGWFSYNFFSIWTWVEVFNPRLYIAHELMKAALENLGQ